MKTNLKLTCAIISTVLLFSSLAVNDAKAQVLKHILKRMEIQQKSLFSFRSKVRIEKYNFQLAESDITFGTVNYLRAARNKIYVRIDWTQPTIESFALVNMHYVLYRPRLKQALLGKMKKIEGTQKFPGTLSFISMSINEIKRNYNIQYLGQKTLINGIKTWHLIFTPKQRTVYQTAEFWVDGTGTPLQAKVVEHNNDSTTVFLSDLKRNATINSAIFRLNLAKGTKIISDGSSGAETINLSEIKTLKRIPSWKYVKKSSIKRRLLRRSKKPRF